MSGTCDYKKCCAFGWFTVKGRKAIQGVTRSQLVKRSSDWSALKLCNFLHCLYGCEAPLASSVSHSCNKRPPEHVSRTQASSPTPPQLCLGRQPWGGSEGCTHSGKGGGFSGPWSFPRMYLTDCSLSMDWRVFFLIINLSNSRALAKANPG